PALPALPELPEGAQQLNVAVFFGFNSAELDPSHEALLESLAAYILEQENSSFVIAGHADAVGSPAYNLLLSQLRASAIKSYLVEDWGIAPDRLEAVGYGEQRMLTDFAPDAPEQRRVAFHMVE
ncbi:MAG: OmpA family protein, partial [Pikeienuella sp.]